MITISNSFDLIRQVKAKPHLQLSKCGILIDTKRAKIVKKHLNGRSIGYWIGRKFVIESNLLYYTEPIPNIDVPF